ncbi:MAG TPA: energy transducer TonB [Candidatus Angelobacter sp.]|nr:energy transducer TonB [Candidatus Angelobacter sp.]
MRYRTNVFAMLMVLLLVSAGYAQQNQTNPNPEKQKAAAEGSPLKVVLRVLPIYPQEAREKRIQGTVVVEAVVDRRGNVISARMINGHRIFEDAALTAIKAWRFAPATLEGLQAEQKTQIKINFLDTAPEPSAAAK